MTEYLFKSTKHGHKNKNSADVVQPLHSKSKEFRNEGLRTVTKPLYTEDKNRSPQSYVKL